MLTVQRLTFVEQTQRKISEGMNEVMDNEVNAIHDDRAPLQSKESGFSRKPGSSNTHGSPEMVIPADINLQESNPGSFSNSKNHDRIGTSEQACTSPRCTNPPSIMVAELNVRNFKSGVWEDSDSAFYSQFLDDNQENQNKTTDNNNLPCDEKQPVREGIRSKILSKSGFSEYFLKSTLNGKGVVCRGLARDEINLHKAAENHHEGVSLREWLKTDRNNVDKSKSLYIFKQILNLVDSSHSQGVPLQALRPSCFRLLPSYEVSYLRQKDFTESCGDKESHYADSKKRKFGDERNLFSRWQQFPSRSGSGSGSNHVDKTVHSHENLSQMQSCVGGDLVEEQWYASPEGLKERCSTLPSNIYSLGVLLFELFGSFESPRTHAIAMMDLRQRILPPSFLSENPKEAGYCLWLIHPEAPSRPTIKDILQSNLVSGVEEASMDEMLSSLAQEDTESELLLYFLSLLREQKQKCVTKLFDNISLLESDIAVVESIRANNSQSHEPIESSPSESRLMSNMSQLESAYFSVRSGIHVSESDTTDPPGQKVLEGRKNGTHKAKVESKAEDRLGIFFNGLCKYARYSKFEVRGTLRSGDFSSSANVICSLGFDRDEDYFATAGVSKKIKVYDFHALLDNSVDIHYPAVEMSNKSKLSCVCWNSYIKNYLASTDYDGVVKLWDAGTGQAVSHHIEHERRAWSVDFSQVNPIKLASGSDDCYVKLWSINEKKSISSIKNIANVCCVQFSPYSPHLLSFGSADYRTYCYDLRNASVPLCILAGHDRAVSYVKFLDPNTLVSASTDNTLKLWDLKQTRVGALSTNACILTFKGHTNEKNFVGLSVANGYIACGSETNEVFAYYRSLPMPITSHKFGSIDPISGKETDNRNHQFVSSICWRQKSDMVVAANSSGCLKLLQMV